MIYGFFMLKGGKDPGSSGRAMPSLRHRVQQSALSSNERMDQPFV